TLKKVASGGPLFAVATTSGCAFGGAFGGGGAVTVPAAAPRWPPGPCPRCPPAPCPRWPPPAPPRPASPRPGKSGLPSAVLGAGALRSGLPSAVLGTPRVGYIGHCAQSDV